MAPTKKESKKQTSEKVTPPKKSGNTNKDKGSKKKSGSSRKSKAPTRYRRIQQILGAYCRANGKKLGKKFNLYASEIYKRTLNDPLKQVENNIDELYFLYVEGGGVPKEFPNLFCFYDFSDLLISDPTFDGVTIGVEFKDGQENFSFKGFATDMLDYYKENMHRYLRVYYNESPVAYFEIVDTDKQKFVNYMVMTDGRANCQEGKKEEEPPTPPTEPPKPPTEPPTEPSRGATREDVEVAKAKAEEEKAKAISKALEMLDKGKISQETFDRIMKGLGV